MWVRRTLFGVLGMAAADMNVEGAVCKRKSCRTSVWALRYRLDVRARHTRWYKRVWGLMRLVGGR